MILSDFEIFSYTVVAFLVRGEIEIAVFLESAKKLLFDTLARICPVKKENLFSRHFSYLFRIALSELSNVKYLLYKVIYNAL